MKHNVAEMKQEFLDIKNYQSEILSNEHIVIQIKINYM